MLTLGLSTSMLHNAVKDLELERCDSFISCFNAFVRVHYYKELKEFPLIDWDEQFEQVVLDHLPSYSSPSSLRNDYLSQVSYALLDCYGKVGEEGVRLEVYNKLKRLGDLIEAIWPKEEQKSVAIDRPLTTQ